MRSSGLACLPLRGRRRKHASQGQNVSREWQAGGQAEAKTTKGGTMNHLEKHEVLAVLKVAREHSELDWLLFAFQYIHSHRISEVLALTPENFEIGRAHV